MPAVHGGPAGSAATDRQRGRRRVAARAASSTLCGVPSTPQPRPRSVAPCPLAALAPLLGSAAEADVEAGHEGLAVTGITHDSRQVRPGDLYAALPGAHTHGARFAAQAAAAGAVAVLTDPAGAAHAPAGLARLVVPDPRAVLGAVAARVYGEPAGELLMLGVTGTNGKTTTTYLLEAGLRAAGHTTGLIGTIETRVGDDRVASIRTTPEATEVHALLAVMRERGASACVMEVSSHALAFGRVDGVRFDLAGFTNLSQDHLDFHAGLEDYFAAKAALFTPQRSRRGVVCVDDEYGRRLARQAGIPVVTVATREEPALAGPVGGPGGDLAADWRVADREVTAGGEAIRFSLTARGGRRLAVRSPLPGEFNVANTALAVVLLLEAGAGEAAAVGGVAGSTGVPGRMERVTAPGAEGPLAVVDYAHTPEAIENVLRALRTATSGRLVVVLGAGGDRDPHKRPLMGAAAAGNADLVIVTDDNPRSEEPAAIRSAVLEGATGPAEVREIGDRRGAIAAAVGAASGAADTVVVVGKGHEQGQEVAGVVQPFDDREVLREALAGRTEAGGPTR